MPIVTYYHDPANPARFTPEEEARLDAMTPEEIEANALSDPDNPPLDEAELAHIRKVHFIRETRAPTGLSQAAFAARYHISPGRLRDLEQGRTQADSLVLAYMALIRDDAEHVARVLDDLQSGRADRVHAKSA